MEWIFWLSRKSNQTNTVFIYIHTNVFYDNPIRLDTNAVRVFAMQTAIYIYRTMIIIVNHMSCVFSVALICAYIWKHVGIFTTMYRRVTHIRCNKHIVGMKTLPAAKDTIFLVVQLIVNCLMERRTKLVIGHQHRMYKHLSYWLLS